MGLNSKQEKVTMERHVIFLDLDGTLLDSEKKLIKKNMDVLTAAWEQGAYIVPATGRLFLGMPAELRAQPFIRYAAAVNGAQIYDAVEDKTIAKVEIPIKRALEIYDMMDSMPGIYDCYAENWGWMERDILKNADKYIADPHHLQIVRDTRSPVDGFKTYIAEHFASIQKAQIFFRDREARAQAMAELTEKLPDCSVASSMPGNIEISAGKANKGDALRYLCEYLDVPIENSIAFGDDLNDIPMIEAAGTGVAMGNANDAVKAAANMITLTNNEAGVADALIKLLNL